jgi:ribosomal protein S18 acetylase RimI-like enzyme
MITVTPTTDPTLLAAVCEILFAAFSAHDGRIDPPSAAHRETPETLAARLDTETLLVARDDDGAVAGCIFYRRESEEEGYIGRLAVAPERQGQGIARVLLRASIDLARQDGVKQLGLAVRVELTENRALFERYGFVVTREDRHPGYDRTTNYHMELLL